MRKRGGGGGGKEGGVHVQSKIFRTLDYPLYGLVEEIIKSGTEIGKQTYRISQEIYASYDLRPLLTFPKARAKKISGVHKKISTRQKKQKRKLRTRTELREKKKPRKNSEIKQKTRTR
jgi:hypothetical protein